MTYEDDVVPVPGGICNKCLNDPGHTHELSEESSVLVSYCPHNNSGGFIQRDLPEMRWTIFAPVGRDEWGEFIKGPICDVIEADHMHLLDKENHYCKCSWHGPSQGST
jgi:hypothetical protein